MADDKGKLMTELRQRMEVVEPLRAEPDFHTSSETLMQFLKARDWNVSEAEKQLMAAVEWRRRTDPLNLECRWCHDRPGFHAIRQVGHDEMGRPVAYSSFVQAATHKNTAEDSIAHCTYIIENAKRTMKQGVNTWVLVIDCTGMTLPACNPKLGYGVTQVMSNFYPERLGLVICLNHSPVFQGVWRAIKVFLHPNTVSKMQLVRSKKKVQDLFDRHFSDELSLWIQEEIRLNKQEPLSQGQREFWRPPATTGVHDPRGAPMYVKDFIEPFNNQLTMDPQNTHRPHPNIIEYTKGQLKDVSPYLENLERKKAVAVANSSECQDKNGGDDSVNGSDNDSTEDCPAVLELEEEFQIPTDSRHLQM